MDQTEEENASKRVEVSVPERKTARVALPNPEDNVEPDADISDDELEEGHIEEDVDILEGLPDDTEEIELLHAQLKNLEKLRLQRFYQLKKLCLRQNFISFLDPETFGALQELVEFDLYDNKVKDIGDALNKMKNLSILDLSFNLLRSVPDNLKHLTLLHTVYFVQNRITHISGLDNLGATLRSLELGGNKIRKIENLEALVNLEELWLGKNKITKLENLGSLKNLKILSAQSNRITKIEGLEGMTNLEQLYLSHNGVERLEGLEDSSKLTTLDLGNNFVPEIENIAHLVSLEELWLNNNKIPTLQALEPQLRSIATLETIYLEGNPCQAAEGTSYRRKIMLALPQLKQIDATFARPG